MEKVHDVLARKSPQFNTITPDAFVSDALYQMCCENIDFLIVLEEERFQGVLSDHDIASKVLFADKPLNKIKVREFMNRTLPVATTDNSLDYCLQLSERYNANYIAIFDNFDFRGVISAHDIMHEIIGQKQETPTKATESWQGYPWNY